MNWRKRWSPARLGASMLTIILAIGSLPQAAGTCSRNIP
jgi:hypothetical protein